MENDRFEAELVERMNLVEDEDYEGEALSAKDHWLLFVCGIVIPLILMIAGWSIG